MNTIDLTWDTYDGGLTGTDADGNELVQIFALQDRYECAKWGEKYTPGREWCVCDKNNNIIARGQARDLRAAKKEAIECLIRAAA